MLNPQYVLANNLGRMIPRLDDLAQIPTELEMRSVVNFASATSYPCRSRLVRLR